MCVAGNTQNGILLVNGDQEGDWMRPKYKTLTTARLAQNQLAGTLDAVRDNGTRFTITFKRQGAKGASR